MSEAQQHEVAREGDRPVEAIDLGTKKLDVLLTAEVFARVEPLLNTGFDIRETYAAQDSAMSKVWSDLELDAYAVYDRHKPLS